MPGRDGGARRLVASDRPNARFRAALALDPSDRYPRFGAYAVLPARRRPAGRGRARSSAAGMRTDALLLRRRARRSKSPQGSPDLPAERRTTRARRFAAEPHARRHASTSVDAARFAAASARRRRRRPSRLAQENWAVRKELAGPAPPARGPLAAAERYPDRPLAPATWLARAGSGRRRPGRPAAVHEHRGDSRAINRQQHCCALGRTLVAGCRRCCCGRAPRARTSRATATSPCAPTARGCAARWDIALRDLEQASASTPTATAPSPGARCARGATPSTAYALARLQR